MKTILSIFIILSTPALCSAQTSATAAVGFYKASLSPGFQTVGVSLVNPAAHAGEVGSSSGSTLLSLDSGADIGSVIDATQAYYVELTDGPGGDSSATYVGHRLEVDPGLTVTSGDNSVTIDLSSTRNTLATLPSLAGYKFVVRKHRTIGEVFDKDQLSGSNNPSLADQVQIFNGTGYDSYFFLDFSSGGSTYYQWTPMSGSLDSADDEVIPSGAGVFYRRADSAGSVDLVITGEVRSNDFVQPLVAGYNLVSEGYPLDASFNDREVFSAEGFEGNTDPSIADQTLVFNGTGFDSYWLLDFNSTTYWTPITGISDENATEVFDYSRAVFLKVASDKPNYKVTVPWDPSAPVN